jgi:hypothetical protein
MKEINEMISKTKQERDLKMKELNAEMERLMKEPYEQFEKDYKGSIHNLSAKEGLGKTYRSASKTCTRETQRRNDKM